MTILKPVTLFALQSMKQKIFYLRIAETAFPGLQQKRFFTTVGDTEYYFSGLRMTEVQHIYRSYYDEFDYAFSIRCTFSVCDRREGSRWIRQPGDDHLYTTPPAVVVQRDELACSPAQIIFRMKNFYKANVLIYSGYKHSLFSENQLREILESNQLSLVHRKDLPEPIEFIQRESERGKREMDLKKNLIMTRRTSPMIASAAG